MLTLLLFLFMIILGYLSGSICSAVIVSRIFSLPDPREQGSRNPGATNVLRLSGKKYAALVFLVDALKGAIPVLIAKACGAGSITIGFTCLAAVLGHMYPLFFDFRGGKGVATAIGAFLAFHFMMGVSVIAVWLLVANFLRYSSLASIIAILVAPLYSLLVLANLNIFPPLFFIALFVLFKHRDNITRLIDGEEPKLNFAPNDLPDMADEILTEQADEYLAETAILEHEEETSAKPVQKKTRTRRKTSTTTKKKDASLKSKE